MMEVIFWGWFAGVVGLLYASFVGCWDELVAEPWMAWGTGERLIYILMLLVWPVSTLMALYDILTDAGTYDDRV